MKVTISFHEIDHNLASYLLGVAEMAKDSAPSVVEEVDERQVVEPESAPEPDEDLVLQVTPQLTEAPKRRGRPKGSKNTPKPPPPDVAVAPVVVPPQTSVQKFIDLPEDDTFPANKDEVLNAKHIADIQKEPVKAERHEEPAFRQSIGANGVVKPDPVPPVNGLPLDLRGVWGLSTPDGQPWKAEHGGLVDADIIHTLKLGDVRNVKEYSLKSGRFRLARELATGNGIEPNESTEPTPASEKLTYMLQEVASAGVPCLGPDRPREWFEKAAITALVELYTDLN